MCCSAAPPPMALAPTRLLACVPAQLQVGSVWGLSFVDIQATAENGIFLAGGPLPHGSTRQSVSRRNSSSEASTGRIAGQRRQRDLQAHLQEQQEPEQEPEQEQEQGGRYSLGGISLERVQLQLKRRSSWPGGCQDYRPSSNITGSSGGSASEGSRWWPAGLDCSSGSTAAVWVAGASHVVLSDVQVGLAGGMHWRCACCLTFRSFASAR